MIKYHCIDDEVAFTQLANKDEGEYRVYLLKWLKDIDALDRIRMGINELDIRYLRNPDAIKFLLVAKLLQNLRF